MLLKEKKKILGEINIGETFEEKVFLMKMEKKLIPILEKMVYVYYFKTLGEGNVLKTIIDKKRNSLKGLEIGDVMIITGIAKEKNGKNFYLIENLRVKNKAVY